MRYLVSILILLEVILEDISVDEAVNNGICFNPYFTGSNSGRMYYQLQQGHLRCSFNPYFTGSNSGS